MVCLRFALLRLSSYVPPHVIFCSLCRKDQHGLQLLVQPPAPTKPQDPAHVQLRRPQDGRLQHLPGDVEDGRRRLALHCQCRVSHPDVFFQVSTADQRRSSPKTMISCNKKSLYLPPEMPAIHVEFTEYYFPDGKDYPSREKKNLTQLLNLRQRDVHNSFCLPVAQSRVPTCTPSSTLCSWCWTPAAWFGSTSSPWTSGRAWSSSWRSTSSATRRSPMSTWTSKSTASC